MTSPNDLRADIRSAETDAVIFDMDGVVTDTAGLHARSWQVVFDDVLRRQARRTGEPQRPYDSEADGARYVDGRPRYDGVRSFLGSRGIRLPEGEPTDGSGRETICGIGNRKNEVFRGLLAEGVRAYESSVRLIRLLQRRGVATAVVSSSRNAEPVLRAAGVRDLFAVKVDGLDAEGLALPGKPHPGLFLEAAAQLGMAPARCAVVEDTRAGVAAARDGGFGLVIGVDRAGRPAALLAAGAEVVVADLSELSVDGEPVVDLAAGS